MRILAILLVIAVAALAALFALGVFDSVEPGDPTLPGTPGSGDPAGNGGAEDPALAGRNVVPDEAPPIEIHRVTEPLNVLLLTRYAERIPAFMAQHWTAGDKIQTYVWAPALPEGAQGTGPAALKAYASVLPEPPDATVLHDKAIHVLALHALDPATLDPAFWDEVVARVRDGRLGLLLMPGRPEGAGLLEYEALKLLSPVAATAKPSGDTTPGVFSRRVPFEPTVEGLSHLATRLVAWPRWSRATWAAKATGEFPWGTQQAWPVEKTAESAVTLLELAPPRGSKIPVLIAFKPERGRVLFFGAYELMDRHGYGIPKNVEAYGLVLRNWIAWLAGRV